MSLGDGGYSPDYRDERRGDGGQTRTRLPEPTGGDVYGRRSRTPARPSKSMVMVVGVVVLLIAAIAFANRDGGQEDAAGAGPGRTGTQAQPTAPSGTSPVTGSKAKIATGFPKTEQGAQSAAANYAVALGGEGMFHAGTRRQVVNTVYAPAVAAAHLDDLDRVYSAKSFLARIGLKPDGSAPDGMTFVSRTNPIGTKLEKFQGTTATVTVWYSTLFGLAGEGSKNPVAESWYTNTFQLKWIDGDWKVTGSEQKEGPTPVGRDQAASSAEDMADAVREFGGFTYAR
jgi:hypothetical protein